MSFEEEFDRIIKQKADEAEFPFEEGNWEKMRGMLEAERKPAAFKAGKWLAMGFALAGVVALGGWLLLHDAGKEPHVSANNTTPVQNEQLGVNAAPQAVAEPVSMTSNVSQENNVAVENNMAAVNDALSNNTAENKTVTKAEPVALASRSSKAHNNHGINKVNAVGVANNNTTANTHVAGASSKASRTVSQNNNANVDAENNAAAVTQASKPMAAQPVANATPNNNGQSDAASTIAAPQAPAATNNDQSPVIENDMPATAATNDAVAYEPLSPIVTRLSFGQDERDIASLPFSTMRRDDDYYKNKDHFKTHFLNVEAGANYLLGWNVKTGKDGMDGKGFNWFAGVNYGFYLTRHIGIGAGVQAYNVGNITQPFYAQSKTEFGFGSATNYTLITSNNLYYAAVPVKLYYALNQQNQFGLGFNMGWLVNASNTVKTYGTSDNAKPTTTKNSGAYNGVAKNNMMISAFYKAQLSNRIYVNAEVAYGLTDLFGNYATKNTETTTGLKLSLQYVLFDK